MRKRSNRLCIITTTTPDRPITLFITTMWRAAQEWRQRLWWRCLRHRQRRLAWHLPHIAPYPDNRGDEDGSSEDQDDCNKGCIDGNTPD